MYVINRAIIINSETCLLKTLWRPERYSEQAINFILALAARLKRTNSDLAKGASNPIADPS